MPMRLPNPLRPMDYLALRRGKAGLRLWRLVLGRGDRMVLVGRELVGVRMMLRLRRLRRLCG